MAKAEKPKETAKTEKHLRCIFTEAELLVQGKKLAELNNELVSIENDKKRVTDDFKAKASAVEADISITSNNIRSGYEYRKVPCTIRFEDPSEGLKTTYRDDTGEQVSCEALTPEEKQRKLILLEQSAQPTA